MSCDSSCSLSEVPKDPLFGDLDLLFFGAFGTTLVLAYSISFLPSCFKTSTPGPVTPVFWKCSLKLLPAGSCVLLELPPSGAVGIRELLDTDLGGDGKSGTFGLSQANSFVSLKDLSL